MYANAKYVKFTKTREAAQGHEQPLDDASFSYPTKTDDFFPYSDCDHCFWTGYFTSRPGLKKLERVGSSFLHAVRQINALASANSGIREDVGESAIYSLEAAMGVAQHHDAVSGTSKQHVAYDYAKKIQGGLNEAADFAAAVLREKLVITGAGGDQTDILSNLSYCQLQNVTFCKVSQVRTITMKTFHHLFFWSLRFHLKMPINLFAFFQASTENDYLYIVLYNALGGDRSEIMKIPVSTADYQVEKLNSSWEPVESVLLSNPNFSMISDPAPFVLHFDTGVIPPVGVGLYRMGKRNGIVETPSLDRPTSERNPESNLRIKRVALTQEKKSNSHTFTVENDVIQVHFKE